jgi:NADH-quinone oxidoreductase subunit C
MAISNQEVHEKLNQIFPGAILKEEQSDMLTLHVAKDKVHDIIKWLKNDNTFQIHFLTLLGGIHFPDNQGHELGVTYHLHSFVNNFRIRLKTFMPISHPHVKSIVDIYDNANWQERETFDFFGIIFEGHPNLKRILNEDDMDYFPMRKEYQLEDATREDKDDRYFGR